MRKKAQGSVLFPEYEVVTEDEPSGIKGDSSDEVDNTLQLMRTVSVSDTAGKDEDADFEETETGVDKAFLKFQKRVEREPEQVIR
ncbi:hypothetical protein HDU96_002544 [Phlyctochytrium bullatum]|nr:hypothetical protein HDU96_002544 [Phlyctochytrium bullatum]